MKTVGLIVEYNPLHNGHVHHFEQSMKQTSADASVAVMSGHFLQRGEPAIVNKWARTEMALRMGVDLVIELPAAFSSQPAEWFAYGAVSALDAAGIVDALCFGSEQGCLDRLLPLAERLAFESPGLSGKIREQLKSGSSYPAAYAKAAVSFTQQTDQADGAEDDVRLLSQPNNVLGLHYCISLLRLGSSIRPATVPRMKSGYHDTAPTDPAIASATALRNMLEHTGDPDNIRPYVPSYAYEILVREMQAGRAPIRWESFRQALFHLLLSFSPEHLESYSEVTEGLEYRMKQRLADLRDPGPITVDRLLDELKTKRYTRTKLQRMLVRILLGHTKSMLHPARLRQGVPYLRVLGFSPAGRKLLKQMRTTAKVPVIVNVPQAAAQPMLDWDIRATSVYASAYADPAAEDWYRDYYEAPLRLS